MRSGRDKGGKFKFRGGKKRHQITVTASDAAAYRSRFGSSSRGYQSSQSIRDQILQRRLSQPRAYDQECNDNDDNGNATKIPAIQYDEQYDFDIEDDAIGQQIPPRRSASANLYTYESSFGSSIQLNSTSVQEIMEELGLWIWDKDDEKNDMDIFMNYHDLLRSHPVFEREHGKKVLIMPMYNARNQKLNETEWVHIVNDKCTADECTGNAQCHHKLISKLIKHDNPTNLFFIVKFAFPTIFITMVP